MKERAMWTLVALLALLSAGEAYYIFGARRKGPPPAGTRAWAESRPVPSYQEPWRELEDWRKTLDNRLSGGGVLNNGDFDSFFNDSFFDRRFTAFDQLERIHREMMDAFEGQKKREFGDSWDKWFSDRLDMGGFDTRVSRAGGKILMTISIPGLDAKNAEINVNRDRVRLSFSARSVGGEKNARGSVRSESEESFEKILPVPSGADGNTARVSVKGDAVTITFAEKKKAKA